MELGIAKKVASVSPDQLCINTIGTLSIDAVRQADSGHPGMPMAPVVYCLWQYPATAQMPVQGRIPRQRPRCGAVLLGALRDQQGRV